jgi:hypothetical protein
MAKRIRKPRLSGKRRELVPDWRWWNDEQLLGRSKDLWQGAESLSPGPRTIQDFADGSMRAKAIIHSYKLLAPIVILSAAEYALACQQGGAGVAL